MKKRFHFSPRGEQGQSIVEAAFVIPLLIVVLCGILDFGWIYTNQLMVDNCSREGARYAAVHSKDSNLSNLVMDRVKQVAAVGAPEDLSVAVVVTSSGDVQVTVSKSVKVLTPLAGIFVDGQKVNLKNVSVMRIG